jgi:hypothetical protein
MSTGTTIARRIDPAPAFARYGSSVVADMGRELATACHEIVTITLASPS